jgi:predicted DNA-binding transcriptional regulator AlpA
MIKESIAVNKKTSLYRHFSKDKKLLYVGISLSALTRLGQHALNAKWFNSISSVSIEHFDTLEKAIKAERAAIIQEDPQHNIKHKNSVYKDPKYIESSPHVKPEVGGYSSTHVPINKRNTHFRIDTVVQYTALSKSHIYKLMKEGEFPLGKDTHGLILWSIREIDLWLDKKIEDSCLNS